MSLPSPPPPQAPVVDQRAPSSFGSASDLEFNTSSTDQSVQNNVSNAANSNVQINTAFQRANAEQLGDGIALNSPLSFYGQVTTVDFGQTTQATVGVNWTPRDKETRKIIKLRKQQIKLAMKAKEDAIVAAQAAEGQKLELHCAKLASQGFSSKTCKDVLVALNPVAQNGTGVTRRTQEKPDPIPARY